MIKIIKMFAILAYAFFCVCVAKTDFKILNNKILKKIVIIILTILLGIFIIEKIFNIFSCIKEISTLNAEEKLFNEYDERISSENEYFKNIISNYENSENYKNPYIPNGFTYVEGTYLSGYVIEDSNKNQYVWVPCLLKKENIENIAVLCKKNFENDAAFISKDLTYDDSYEEFMKSVCKNRWILRI